MAHNLICLIVLHVDSWCTCWILLAVDCASFSPNLVVQSTEAMAQSLWNNVQGAAEDFATASALFHQVPHKKILKIIWISKVSLTLELSYLSSKFSIFWSLRCSLVMHLLMWWSTEDIVTTVWWLPYLSLPGMTLDLEPYQKMAKNQHKDQLHWQSLLCKCSVVGILRLIFWKIQPGASRLWWLNCRELTVMSNFVGRRSEFEIVPFARLMIWKYL